MPRSLKCSGRGGSLGGHVSLCAHRMGPSPPPGPPIPSPLPGLPAPPAPSLLGAVWSPRRWPVPPHTQAAPPPAELPSLGLARSPLHGSEMPPSCPLRPLISFRICFPFRTELQPKKGPAPEASGETLCDHVAGGDLGPVSVWGPRVTASSRRSGAATMLHAPSPAGCWHRDHRGASRTFCPGGLGTAGWASLSSKYKWSLSGVDRCGAFTTTGRCPLTHL